MMLEIILPWPDPKLAPNRRLGKHWTSTAVVKVRAKSDGYGYAIEATKANYWPFEGQDRIPLHLTFCPPDRRKRDLDNLLSTQKHMLDGIAEGLGFDDRKFCPITLTWGDVTEGGCVVVRIG
jgi:crossover junction endodeoxyribonuclease RusA